MEHLKIFLVFLIQIASPAIFTGFLYFLLLLCKHLSSPAGPAPQSVLGKMSLPHCPVEMFSLPFGESRGKARG